MDLSPLARPGAPWLHLLVDPTPERLDAIRTMERATSLPRIAVRIVRGAKSQTVPSFYDEISAALQFPTFGENWDALHDCLCDLGWLACEGCVLLITEPSLLLKKAGVDQVSRLHAVLTSAAENWSQASKSRPARPFHVVLCASAAEADKLAARWTDDVGVGPHRLAEWRPSA